MSVKIEAAHNATSSDIEIFRHDFGGNIYREMPQAIAAVESAGHITIEAAEGYWVYPADMTDAEIARDVAGYHVLGSIEEVDA
ncbi:MAG: hypothetical protein WC295_01520 [Methanoregula sp.]|jgi:hypothetical protein